MGVVLIIAQRGAPCENGEAQRYLKIGVKVRIVPGVAVDEAAFAGF